MRTLIPILLAFAAAAQAGQVTLNINMSALTGTPGQILAFDATLTNNTANTLFINGDSFTFPIGGAVDDTPFLLNAPLSLDPLTTSANFEIFDVTAPSLGTYNGVFTVLGGTDGTQLLNVGSASFVVQSVPEPAPFLSIGAAIAALLGCAGVKSNLVRL